MWQYLAKKKKVSTKEFWNQLKKKYSPNLSEHSGLNKIQLGEKVTDIINSHSVSFAKNFGFMS